MLINESGGYIKNSIYIPALGTPEGIRTPGLLIRSQVLSPLSYRGMERIPGAAPGYLVWKTSSLLLRYIRIAIFLTPIKDAALLLVRGQIANLAWDPRESNPTLSGFNRVHLPFLPEPQVPLYCSRGVLLVSSQRLRRHLESLAIISRSSNLMSSNSGSR